MTTATSEEATFKPRMNHVAFTMDHSLLTDEGRAEILDFYGDVFGWTEGDNSTESGNPLILYTGAWAEFVYLLPGDEPLQCPRLERVRREPPGIAGHASSGIQTGIANFS